MSIAGEVQHAAEIYITGHANVNVKEDDDDDEEKELSVHLSSQLRAAISDQMPGPPREAI